MKKLILTLCILICSNIDAQNVVFDWAKQIAGNTGDYVRIIKIDSFGSIYRTGTFSGTVDFDPGVNTYNLTSNGDYDIYISKLDSNGNFVWAKQIGGPKRDRVYALILDDHGNLYTTGGFGGTVDFDPGANTYNLTSKSVSSGSCCLDDIFISKLDSAGDFKWAKRIGGTGSDLGQSITLDLFGSIYITGYFSGGVDVDFDPGINTYYLKPTNADVFICKLDSGGNFIWAKQMGGTGQDIAYSIATDGHGNVYSTGTFTGTADFDPGINTYNLTSSGGGNVFISKLNSAGNFVWAKQIVGLTYTNIGYISLDALGNVYSISAFSGTVDFDPGVNTYNLTSNGDYDIYISKLDSNGNFVWAKQIGGSQREVPYSMAIDSLGNMYITGGFGGTVDFDPGTNTYNLTSSGASNAFISKLNSAGNFVWAKRIGSNTISGIYGSSVTLNALGDIYTSGIFRDSVDFDPGSGFFYLHSISSSVFICKFSPQSCIETYGPIDTITSCGSYKWRDGITYTSSNSTAKWTLSNKNGCDSIISLHLTLQYPNGLTAPKICAVSVDSASGKNEVIWEKYGLNRAVNYNIYRENTISQFVKIGTVHKDSFSTFIDTGSKPLTQAYKYKLTITDSCKNETSIDSSSFHKTVHLTSNVGVGGEVNLIWNLYEGKSYTSHNIMRSANGGAFVKIAQVASNISAYSDLTPPSGSLVYKISLSSNVCRPSRSTYGLIQSNPVFIRPSAVNGIENLSFSMYPNPASSAIEIQSQNNFSKIEILDIEGRLVKELVLDTNSSKVDVSGLCVGVYFVKVTYQGLGTVVQKILID